MLPVDENVIRLVCSAGGVLAGLAGAYLAVIRDLSFLKGQMTQLLETQAAKHALHESRIIALEQLAPVVASFPN